MRKPTRAQTDRGLTSVTSVTSTVLTIAAFRIHLTVPQIFREEKVPEGMTAGEAIARGWVGG